MNVAYNLNLLVFRVQFIKEKDAHVSNIKNGISSGHMNFQSSSFLREGTNKLLTGMLGIIRFPDFVHHLVLRKHTSFQTLHPFIFLLTIEFCTFMILQCKWFLLLFHFAQIFTSFLSSSPQIIKLLSNLGIWIRDQWQSMSHNSSSPQCNLKVTCPRT